MRSLGTNGRFTPNTLKLVRFQGRNNASIKLQNEWIKNKVINEIFYKILLFKIFIRIFMPKFNFKTMELPLLFNTSNNEHFKVDSKTKNIHQGKVILL